MDSSLAQKAPSSHIAIILFLSLLLPLSGSNNQFCDAGTEYGKLSCGTATAPTTKILIKGGTVVNAHHKEVSDVYIEDGIIAAVQKNIVVKASINVHVI